MLTQSFTSAAKKMTALAGLRWPHVLKIYRALQERTAPGTSAPEGWLPPQDILPYSNGGQQWAAHPNFMARLLIAVVGCDDPAQARRTVETFIWASENGTGGPPNLQDYLVQFMTDPEAAAKVERVDFFPDTSRVCFNFKIGEPVWFWMDEEELRPDDTSNDIKPQAALIRRNGAIDGELLRLLCREIGWRIGPHPFVPRSPTQDAE